MTENLGFIKAIHRGNIPPINTEMIWFDTINQIHKVYNFTLSQWRVLTSDLLHNNLSGFQGGTSTELYHLSANQHTIATSAASGIQEGYITTSSQSLAGLKTFSKQAR